MVDLGLGLAHAGEDDAIDGFGRCGNDAVELAAGDNVKAGAVSGEQLENRQRRIGLYGIADQVIATRERVMKSLRRSRMASAE